MTFSKLKHLCVYHPDQEIEPNQHPRVFLVPYPVTTSRVTIYAIFFSFLKSALSYSLHTINFTDFKYTIDEFWQMYIVIHQPPQSWYRIFSSPRKFPLPSLSSIPSLYCWFPATTDRHSVTIVLLFSRTSYKWNCT